MKAITFRDFLSNLNPDSSALNRRGLGCSNIFRTPGTMTGPLLGQQLPSPFPAAGESPGTVEGCHPKNLYTQADEGMLSALFADPPHSSRIAFALALTSSVVWPKPHLAISVSQSASRVSSSGVKRITGVFFYWRSSKGIWSNMEEISLTLSLDIKHLLAEGAMLAMKI